MDPLDNKKRIFAAHKLLLEKSTTRQKFDSLRTLLKGINPRIDALLDESSKALAHFEKVHKGEIIELTVEHLPEITEENKRRKKALIWFIRNWKSLKGEVERIGKELEKEAKTPDQNIEKGWRIVSAAKGPVGIITVLAVITVVGLSVFGRKKTEINDTSSYQNNIVKTPTPVSSREKIKVIIFNDKQIRLTELTTGQGQECLTGQEEAPHYHAKDHTSAKALDDTSVSDPGGCGFGKVSEVTVVEVE